MVGGLYWLSSTGNGLRWQWMCAFLGWVLRYKKGRKFQPGVGFEISENNHKVLLFA